MCVRARVYIYYNIMMSAYRYLYQTYLDVEKRIMSLQRLCVHSKGTIHCALLLKYVHTGSRLIIII